jgi:hypothetical protein
MLIAWIGMSMHDTEVLESVVNRCTEKKQDMIVTCNILVNSSFRLLLDGNLKHSERVEVKPTSITALLLGPASRTTHASIYRLLSNNALHIITIIFL